MAGDTDVLSTRLSGTATAVAARARLKGISAIPTASAGTITFRDGGASGTVRCVIDTLAAATGPHVPIVPGDGILFQTDMHVTMSNVAFVTIFYA